MNSGTRAEYPCGSNKGLRGKSRLRQEGTRVRKEIPEEGRRVHRPKRCTDINKYEDNSPKNRNTTSVFFVRVFLFICSFIYLFIFVSIHFVVGLIRFLSMLLFIFIYLLIYFCKCDFFVGLIRF